MTRNIILSILLVLSFILVKSQRINSANRITTKAYVKAFLENSSKYESFGVRCIDSIYIINSKSEFNQYFDWVDHSRCNSVFDFFIGESELSVNTLVICQVSFDTVSYSSYKSRNTVEKILFNKREKKYFIKIVTGYNKKQDYPNELKSQDTGLKYCEFFIYLLPKVKPDEQVLFYIKETLTYKEFKASITNKFINYDIAKRYPPKSSLLDYKTYKTRNNFEPIPIYLRNPDVPDGLSKKEFNRLRNSENPPKWMSDGLYIFKD